MRGDGVLTAGRRRRPRCAPGPPVARPKGVIAHGARAPGQALRQAPRRAAHRAACARADGAAVTFGRPGRPRARVAAATIGAVAVALVAVAIVTTRGSPAPPSDSPALPARTSALERAALRYDMLDATGAADAPGSYAFLSTSGVPASAVDNFGYGAFGSSELRIHPTDADGVSRAGFYDTVRVGDIFDFRATRADGGECGFRFRVRSVGASTTPRTFGIADVATDAGDWCRSVDDPGGSTSVEFLWGGEPAPGPAFMGVMVHDEPHGEGTYRLESGSPWFIDVPAGMRVINLGPFAANPGGWGIPLQDEATGSVMYISLETGTELWARRVTDAAVDALFDRISASIRLRRVPAGSGAAAGTTGGWRPQPASTVLAVGGLHSCRVTEGGAVACRGLDSYGQSSPPDGTFVSVSAGTLHSCGVRTDGAVACWGLDGHGQASPPDGTFVAVAAGDVHSCGVRTDGAVACWGGVHPPDLFRTVATPDLTLTSPVSGTYVSLDAGTRHTCGVTEEGRLRCWGWRDWLPLENGRPAGTYASVSSGSWHTCAVHADGTVACWGWDDDGQASPPGGAFDSVAAGWDHTCGMRPDGSVECWGADEYGQSSPPEGDFLSVAAGERHTCGMRTDGTVACWGREQGWPAWPDGAYASVGSGRRHACAVRTDGTVACWGSNDYGQSSPPAGEFTSVSGGWGHTCGLRTDGSITCWGADWGGRASPPAGEFTSVSAAGSFTCGLRPDGSAACWGRDGAAPPAGEFASVSGGVTDACGIRADGSLVCWPGPSGPVSWEGDFVAAASGFRHACALGRDGSVECRGNNVRGQLEVPVGSYASITAGWFHTCAIDAGGAVTCWGSDEYGQLSSPDGSFASVSAGGDHTCGVRDDGSAVCWGRPPTKPDRTPGREGSRLALDVTGAGCRRRAGARPLHTAQPGRTDPPGRRHQGDGRRQPRTRSVDRSLPVLVVARADDLPAFGHGADASLVRAQRHVPSRRRRPSRAPAGHFGPLRSRRCRTSGEGWALPLISWEM